METEKTNTLSEEIKKIYDSELIEKQKKIQEAMLKRE